VNATEYAQSLAWPAGRSTIAFGRFEPWAKVTDPLPPIWKTELKSPVQPEEGPATRLKSTVILFPILSDVSGTVMKTEGWKTVRRVNRALMSGELALTL